MKHSNEQGVSWKDFYVVMGIAAAILLLGIGFVCGLIISTFEPEYPYNQTLCLMYAEELTEQVDNGHIITVNEGKTIIELCTEDPDTAIILTTVVDLTDWYRSSEYYLEPNQ